MIRFSFIVNITLFQYLHCFFHTLIVRRNRDIAKGTGTMLSPNDRALGDTYKDTVVLTMYKVTGNKGWEGQQIWMPNIKLPGDVTYYSGDFLTN